MPAAAGGAQGDLDEWAEPLVEFHVGLLECAEFHGVAALHLGRILQAPMQGVVRAREDRAGLAGPIAYGDDVVEGLAGELVDRLAAGR